MNIDTPTEFEPFKSNRFYVEFTSGIEVEPYRVSYVSLSNDSHFMKIFEIIGENILFKTLKRDTKVSYNIHFLDSAGATHETLSYKGKIKDTYLGTLSHENDEILNTEIHIEVLENVD